MLYRLKDHVGFVIVGYIIKTNLTINGHHFRLVTNYKVITKATTASYPLQSLWSLSMEILTIKQLRSAATVSYFKRRLKTYLFSQDFT